MPDPAAPTSDSELRAHVGRVLSAHYELDCEIGRGGMGIVYRARDRRLKRTVAIKVLPPELAFRSEIRSRFLREAETAAGLSHPNIVPIYAVDEAEGLVFFVMALIEGDNLAKRLHDHGVMGADEVRRILSDVADALAYAHDRGVVHRDIKPDNILLDAESGRPMVTDFGIARAVTEGGDSRLTATGMAIGTPAYMSPEQAAGEREIDGRSDLYSLGVVAYQMLVGEPPFTASSTPAMLVKVISERPIPVDHRRTDLPVELSRAIMMCLEKDPANRFPSASALVEALTTGTMPAYPSVSRPREPESLARGFVGAPPAYPALGAGYEATLDYPMQRSSYGGTLEERNRQDAPPVVEFRKKLVPFLFVNAVIVLVALFGDPDFFTITVLWSIYIAYRYAKLYSDGFDWRDVFRQPREKELIDVADEGIESMRAVFDREKRQELREKRRERLLLERDASARQSLANPMPRFTAPLAPSPTYDRLSRPSYAPASAASTRPPAPPVPPVGAPAPVGGAAALDSYARDRIVQAKSQVDDVYRLVDQLPREQREMVKADSTKESSLALAEKIRLLTMQLADIDQALAGNAQERLEAEIAKYEAQANPLEPASESRVRQLVALKRHRRALAEKATRRTVVARQLEECELALGMVRSHLARLVSSPSYGPAPEQNYQQVTLLVERALSVADRVDGAIHAVQEVDRMTSRPPGGR